jgi:peroxin-16
MRTSQSKFAADIAHFQLTICRAWIHAVTRKLRNKPLLDIVGGVIEDYEFLWDQYYSPTATM